MINKSLKHELDQLKDIVTIETKATWVLSYGDVLSYLINEFKNSRTIEYNIEPKLNIAIPLEKISTLVSTKLDSKQRFSFSVES